MNLTQRELKLLAVVRSLPPGDTDRLIETAKIWRDADWAASLTPATQSSPAPGMQRLLYDRKTAALMLSISARSLDYMIANKKLDTVRKGRKVMVTYQSLKKYAPINQYESFKKPR